MPYEKIFLLIREINLNQFLKNQRNILEAEE